MEFKKWIRTPIKYEEDYYIEDVLGIMLSHIVRWYNDQNELSFLTDGGTFEYKFKEFFYEVYHKGIVRKNELAFDENFQNFDLKYSEDIQTIFEKYKEMEKAYALDLFRDKSYDHLIEFLYEYFDIMEEISDDENALDGTNYYLAYNINDQH